MKAIFQKILSFILSILTSLGIIVLPEMQYDDTVSVSSSENIVMDGETVYKFGDFSFTVSSAGDVTITGFNLSGFYYNYVVSVPPIIYGYPVKEVVLGDSSYEFWLDTVYLPYGVELFSVGKNICIANTVFFSPDTDFHINLDEDIKITCVKGSKHEVFARQNSVDFEAFELYDENYNYFYYLQDGKAVIEHLAPQYIDNYELPEYIDGYEVSGIEGLTLADRHKEFRTFYLPFNCKLLINSWEYSDNPYTLPKFKCDQNSECHKKCYAIQKAPLIVLPDGTVVERNYGDFGYVPVDWDIIFLDWVIENDEVHITGWRENYYAMQPGWHIPTKLVIPETIAGYPVTSVTNLTGEVYGGYLVTGTLREVVLPPTVKELGTFAFAFNKELTTINLENVERFYGNALEDTALRNIRLNRVTEISNGFASAYITGELYFAPDCPLRTIPDDAFAICDFDSIVLSEKVESIGSRAFMSSGVDTLVIPRSVKSVGEDIIGMVNSLVFLNKDTEFPASKHLIYGSCNIYGYAGSTAEAYAQKYGYTFIEISETQVYFDGKSVDGKYIPIDSSGMTLKEFYSHISVSGDAEFSLGDVTVKEGTVIPLINKGAFIEKSYTIVRLGDFNGDETVSVDDLVGMKALISGVLADTVTERDAASVDFNMDGVVNSTDLVYMKSYLVGNY